MENLNKICAAADWDDPELTQIMRQVYHPNSKEPARWLEMKHRKHWEWAIGMLALQKLGKLTPDAVALGVGSGSETPLFFLTNHVRYVMSTDLYTINSKQWTEADVNMLANPDRLAPHPYNRRRLGVQVMSGTDLRFEDNTFDIVFSYSSIEHFGGKRTRRRPCVRSSGYSSPAASPASPPRSSSATTWRSSSKRESGARSSPGTR